MDWPVLERNFATDWDRWPGLPAYSEPAWQLLARGRNLRDLRYPHAVRLPGNVLSAYNHAALFGQGLPSAPLLLWRAKPNTTEYPMCLPLLGEEAAVCARQAHALVSRCLEICPAAPCLEKSAPRPTQTDLFLRASRAILSSAAIL
jgi:hypothetical protein